VNAYLEKAGLAAMDRESMRDYIGGILTRFYALAYLQQVVVGVVAALGVVTALLISVLQRKRELGLLLAVGATPAQVIRSVLWEALFMGAFGSLLGVAIGVPLEWYVVKVIFYDESGFSLDVLVPWKQAISISAGSIALATLAGVLPAWHAVRTRITDAIAYE
jgi:putative ABC transport system permease protein